MSVVLSFLKNHWKPLSVVAAFILTAVGSYSLGRYGVPERVVIQEKLKVVEVEKERLVVVESTVEKKVYVSNESQRIHREEYQVKHPDGTEELTKKEDINVDKVVTDTQVKYVDRTIEKEVVKYVDREVEKRVDVTKPSPDWRISPMLGVNAGTIPGAIAAGELKLADTVVGGLEVQRRIWGPVSLGAWGLTSGQVGVTASLEF